MILTCPACTMRYLVSEGAVGPEGRKVRCAHCGHQWFQEGEMGLDEALFNNEEEEIDISSFIEEEDEEAPFEVPSLPTDDEDGDDFQSILQKEMDIPDAVKPVFIHDDVVLPTPSDIKVPKIPPAKLGGFATALTVWAIIAGIFLILQPQISRAWPASNLVFNMIGLKPVPPGEGLALDELRAEMGEGKIRLTGTVINLKENELKVPSVMASIVDKEDKEIDKILIPPPIARLKAEGRASFDVFYPKIPDGAANVNFGFSFVKSEPAAEAPSKDEVVEKVPTAPEDHTGQEPDYDKEEAPQNPAPHH